MMKMMLSLGTTIMAAVLMAGGAAAAAAEDWRYLIHTDVYAAGIDAGSIQREGNAGRARLLTAPIGRAPRGVVQALMVMDVEVDCAASRTRVVHRQGFISGGSPLEALPSPDAPWQPVRPGTPAGTLAAVLCDPRPLDPRSSTDVFAFKRFADGLPRPSGQE